MGPAVLCSSLIYINLRMVYLRKGCIIEQHEAVNKIFLTLILSGLLVNQLGGVTSTSRESFDGTDTSVVKLKPSGLCYECVSQGSIILGTN